MNARFAERCKANPLVLSSVEEDLALDSSRDRKVRNDLLLNCEKDIYVGVFFDGTNNNKYRDTPNFSQSNVARLYEVFPGTPAKQDKPTLLPRVLPGGGKQAREVSPDSVFEPSSVASADLPYYRKIYVPGVGTAMPNVGDDGIGLDKTGGLAAAFLGQARLEWASLQLVNQVHAAVFRVPIESSVDLTSRWGSAMARLARMHPLLARSELLVSSAATRLREAIAEIEALARLLDVLRLEDTLTRYERRLRESLLRRGRNKPDLRKIRVSVFGFSRGAAAARAWVNLITQRWGTKLAGIPLQIDFLGLFDTVASVGLAQSTPTFEGHGAWAGASFMPVPESVKRCVHLVAAFEVRGSFPLDSVCQGEALPSNCKEIVYPGVHSDVGGGYPPGDQGRALGEGADGDARKISQIPLAQMYREARMAGVPLPPGEGLDKGKAKSFAIDPQLRDDFNAYVAATRIGSVPPTEGNGERAFARMFPTETQPREELFRLMRRHYGIMLRWRKAMLNREGGMAGLAVLKQATGESKHQDSEDIRGAEKELAKEIVFLQSTDPGKFSVVDDPLDQKLAYVRFGGGLHPVLMPLAAKILGSTADVMRDKQRQWDVWIQDEWASHEADSLPRAAQLLFERYVHDSRAWFKPLWTSDDKGMAPDDESWFVLGGREDVRARINAPAASSGAHGAPAGGKAVAEAWLRDDEGQPLIRGGREPYRMWGYLRHRMIYQSGKLSDRNWSARQETVEAEERQRELLKRRDDMLATEKARHEAEVRKIRDRNREVVSSGRLDDSQLRDFNRGAQAQLDQEERHHQKALQDIEGMSSGR